MMKRKANRYSYRGESMIGATIKYNDVRKTIIGQIIGTCKENIAETNGKIRTR